MQFTFTFVRKTRECGFVVQTRTVQSKLNYIRFHLLILLNQDGVQFIPAGGVTQIKQADTGRELVPINLKANM